MSTGIKPYDFVQQVYYAQEKVLLDFIPTDDKYREVLVEANFVLQELQAAQDWTWLREKIILGTCTHDSGEIPEWELPDWVYKISGCMHDCLRLIMPDSNGGYINGMYMDIPIASVGDNQYFTERMMTGFGGIHWPDLQLRAVRVGNIITFNRELTPFEQKFTATLDVQKKINLIHVCDETCRTASNNTSFNYNITAAHNYTTPCDKIESDILIDIPDPNYVIMATAARHAEGSPPALSRIAGLQDNAQKILSSMRQNDAEATDSDYADWDIPGYTMAY